MLVLKAQSKVCSSTSIWSSCFEISGPDAPLSPFKNSLAAIFQCDNKGENQFVMSCSCSQDVSHTVSQSTLERRKNQQAASILEIAECNSICVRTL